MEKITTSHRIVPIAMLLVLMVAFAFSLDGSTRYTIRRDELTTLGHIGALEDDLMSFPITKTIESLALHSADHAPLFYIILNEWGEIVDYHFFALRMLSIWCGLLAVAGTYWVGKKLVDHQTGLIAATLFATNVVFYSNVHEMREWMMLTMVGVLSWMCYLHIIKKATPVHKSLYLVLFALTAIGLYTNYLIIILWATVGLYHLLAVERDRRWWYVSISVVLGGLTFIPWLPVFVDGLGFAQSHIDRDNPKLINNLEIFELTSYFWGNGLVVLFALLVLLSIYMSWRHWDKARDLVFFFVMMIAGIIILNEIFPFLKRIRYLIFFVIPFLLFVSFGLTRFQHHVRLRFLPVLVVVVWIFAGYQFTYSDTFNKYTTKDRTLLYPEYNHMVPLIQYLDARRDLFIQAHYEYSAIRESKQGLMSIDNYYLRELKMTWVNLPQYIEWKDSQIDATPLEYATGLLPQWGRLWFSYHEDRVTEDVQAFMDLVEENYDVCMRIEYGERSVLIRYVQEVDFYNRCITEFPE